MAFDRTKLGSGSAQNTTLPRIFTYTTTDTDTVLSTSGYFNTAADVLNVGDIIQCSCDTDGTPVYGTVVVIENASGTVDVSDIVVHPQTDTE